MPILISLLNPFPLDLNKRPETYHQHKIDRRQSERVNVYVSAKACDYLDELMEISRILRLKGYSLTA